jgi:hypothetical protein
MFLFVEFIMGRSSVKWLLGYPETPISTCGSGLKMVGTDAKRAF